MQTILTAESPARNLLWLYCVFEKNKDIKVCIEVNTPLGRDDEKRTTLEVEKSNHTWGSLQIQEIAPFGLPERKGIDFVSSEAISKIASI